MQLRGFIVCIIGFNNKNKQTTDKKFISFKQDRQKLWLLEVLHANKRDVLWFMGSFESCLQKVKVLTQKMKKLYDFLAIFETNRPTLWFRGNVCNQKGSPRVH